MNWVTIFSVSLAICLRGLAFQPALNNDETTQYSESGNGTAKNGTSSERSRIRYEIEYCGGTSTRILNDVLSRIPIYMDPVLSDVGQGVKSKYGFKAIFKSDRQIKYVQFMLNSINTGRQLPGLVPGAGTPGLPRFACVTLNTRQHYAWLGVDPFLICRGIPPFPGLAAFYVQGTKYIFLCDSFWMFPRLPDGVSQCMSVSNNQFIGDGHYTYGYQVYIMIHELLHFYLGPASLGPSSLPPEQYFPNDLVNLFARNSIRNPTNYQLYMAMVNEACLKEPDPFRAPFNLKPSGLDGSDGGAYRLSNDTSYARCISIPNDMSFINQMSNNESVPSGINPENAQQSRVAGSNVGGLHPFATGSEPETA